MWLRFKGFCISICLIVVVFASNAQQSNGLVYNLKQNWVQYDETANGFLPVISNDFGNSISFKIDGQQFSSHNLHIYTNKKASLFYGNTFLTTLNVGGHSYDIDSLVNYLAIEDPLLTIYGSKLKDNIQTFIVDKTYSDELKLESRNHFRKTSFTTYYILALVIILVFLVFIKMKYPDLFSQYNALQRAFNPQTIDELIYKGRFFENPSFVMILWMSFGSAFVLNFLTNKLNIDFVLFSNFESSSVLFYMVNWVGLSFGFLVLFIIRYWLVYLMSSIFDMTSTKNIHFASHLRLTYLFLIVLMGLITFDYFSIILFNRASFIRILFGSLFVIILLIGLRLTFINKHTFVYKFLYLCGTEIFLYVFVYKLVVG